MPLPLISDDATELLQPREGVIDGWVSFQAAVNGLIAAHPTHTFVWRGQRDARWGLHSSLSRALAEHTRVPPTESELVRAEQRLLRLARTQWRLDGIPALPLFARMQHVGVPTRLLDVTYNPLIAAWFAVSREGADSGVSARLLAFTAGRPLQLNSNWNTNTPRWHRLHTDAERRAVNWGTGLGRKIWRPPALHPRIPAQNAAFILDGVPIEPLDAAPGRSDGRLQWSAAELRGFSSVPMRLAQPDEQRLPKEAPVFTFRITPRAKAEIRTQLEDGFGYRFATIYADIEGLAEYVRRRPDVLTEE